MKEKKLKKLGCKNILKKCICGLALAVTICVTGSLLAGCADGKDGRNGVLWYSGIETPTTSSNPANEGDFYFDEDDGLIYKFTANGWQLISNIKGDSGQTGPQGPQGNPGESGSQGDKGEQGEPGKDGATWLFGAGVPANTQGKNGDFYLDTTSYTIYVKTNDGWTTQGSIKGEDGDKGETGDKGDKGDQGNTGDKGDQGDKGEDGLDGATWLFGSTVPTASQGKNGDFYLDTTTYTIYVKADGEWTTQGSIKGDKGDDGETPTISINDDGYWVINGETTTIKAVGQDGTDGQPGQNGHTPELSINSEGYWVIDGEVTDIKATGNQGPQGDKGETGDKGDKGDSGLDGATWLFGTTVPTSSQGKNGDFYLDTTTYTVYVKANDEWTTQGSIKGEDGEKGDQGDKGDKGDQGNTGDKGDKGDNGNDGVDGATWLFGTTAPTATQGKDGDFYLDTTTYTVYVKANGEWATQGSIKGEDGEKGEQGDKGETGETGKDGGIWITGSGTPNSSTGKDGDMYLDTATYNIYSKQNGEWVYAVNLKYSEKELKDPFTVSGSIITGLTDKGRKMLESSGTLFIPEAIYGTKITQIGNNAFADNTNIENVIFSSSVVSIGNSAFAGCSNLKEVYLPENLKTIGSKAFDGCAFSEFTISQNIQTASNIFGGNSSSNYLNLDLYIENLSLYTAGITHSLGFADKYSGDIYVLKSIVDSVGTERNQEIASTFYSNYPVESLKYVDYIEKTVEKNGKMYYQYSIKIAYPVNNIELPTGTESYYIYSQKSYNIKGVCLKNNYSLNVAADVPTPDPGPTPPPIVIVEDMKIDEFISEHYQYAEDFVYSYIRHNVIGDNEVVNESWYLNADEEGTKISNVGILYTYIQNNNQILEYVEAKLDPTISINKIVDGKITQEDISMEQTIVYTVAIDPDIQEANQDLAGVICDKVFGINDVVARYIINNGTSIDPQLGNCTKYTVIEITESEIKEVSVAISC